MKALLNVLFCDDDNQFAATMAKSLQHKLELRHGITAEVCRIQTLSNLDRLLQISSSVEAQEWDCIFCDLGWANLTLEGIQILNNIQLQNPRIFTVLYTAQDEDEIIGQALRWKLDFIDRILKIEGSDYFDLMLQILSERFEKKRAGVLAEAGQAGPDVTLRGLRLLPREAREAFSKSVGERLRELEVQLMSILENSDKELAADVCIAKGAIEMKLRPDPRAQRSLLLQELMQNLRRFPQLESHALLGLDKACYEDYVMKTYGGFPAMAEARSLDLNHIYRVNRKFKQSPLIVFRFDTVQEMVGLYDEKERNAAIQTLLLPLARLKEIG